MSNYKRIFIVGHSGAGKGLLAQALAKKLGWQFIDSDFALAPSIGRNMVDILGERGKEAFQHCLTDIILNQVKKDNIVVLTDDSVICNEKNCQLLSNEFSVYLKVSLPVQLERIGHNRPLLPVTDYRAFLEKLHQECDALYEEVASFSISSDDGDIDAHVAEIIKAMKK